MGAPIVKVRRMGESTWLDITTKIKEFSITHEDVDDENGTGRDKQKNGDMARTFIGQKHTMQVTLRRIYAADMQEIFSQIRSSKASAFYEVYWLDPCQNSYKTTTVYTSTINYGAQRYDRRRGLTFYDGVSFKMIQQ